MTPHKPSLICTSCESPRLGAIPDSPPPTPYQSYLHSNHETSHDDSASTAIQESLVHLESKKRHIEELKKAFLTYDASLTSRMVQYERSIIEHRYLLSPIRRLPNEVLGEIFVATLDAIVRDNPWSFNTLDVSAPPWIFGKICRRWRSVALLTPRLWNVLPHLDVSALTPEKLQLVITCFRLSRNLPLALVIQTPLRPLGGSIEEDVMKAVVPCSMRLYSLDMVGTPSSLNVFSALRDRLDSLSVLSLNLYNHFPANPPDTIDIFSNSPKLTVVSLSRQERFWKATDFQWLILPWSQLTVFTAARLKPDYGLKLLSSAPQLRICNLRAIFEYGQIDHQPVRHVNLTSLSIDQDEDDFPLIFLGLLELPALLHFHVRSNEITAVPLLSLITRSGCDLVVLHIDAQIPPADLLQLLEETPKLKYLHIQELLTDVLQALAGISTLVVPSLQVITITSAKGDVDPGLFNAMIRFRVNFEPSDNADPPFRACALRFPSAEDAEEYLYRLRGCIDVPGRDPRFQKILSWQQRIEEIVVPVLSEMDTIALHDVLREIEDDDMDFAPYLAFEDCLCNMMAAIVFLGDMDSNVDLESVHELAGNLTYKWCSEIFYYGESPQSRWRASSTTPGYIYYQPEGCMPW